MLEPSSRALRYFRAVLVCTNLRAPRPDQTPWPAPPPAPGEKGAARAHSRRPGRTALLPRPGFPHCFRGPVGAECFQKHQEPKDDGSEGGVSVGLRRVFLRPDPVPAGRGPRGPAAAGRGEHVVATVAQTEEDDEAREAGVSHSRGKARRAPGTAPESGATRPGRPALAVGGGLCLPCGNVHFVGLKEMKDFTWYNDHLLY